MSQEDKTVLVDDVIVKEGVSQRGKPYKRLVLSWKGEDGSTKFASAFGDGLAEHANPLKGETAIITVENKPDGFVDLLAIRPAPKEPKLGTGDYVTGQKPAIEVRRMCALNAATNATAMTAELLKHQTGQEITPELYRAAWDAMHNHCFMANLRACRAMEDEDIPF